MPRSELKRCQRCGAPIWFRKTANGKWQPCDVDLVAGRRASTPHFGCTPRMGAATTTDLPETAELPF